MTISELKQYVIAEASKLVNKVKLNELDADYDFRRDEEPRKKWALAPYDSEDETIDFAEELSIVERNLFSPVVEKFLLNKRAEQPNLDWGDFEDWDNVSSIFEYPHTRQLFNITDEEIIDIAGDIKAIEYRNKMDKIWQTYEPKNEGVMKKMTKQEFQNYIISEATKLYKIEVLKERKESIDKQLGVLNENEYDVYDDPNVDVYSGEFDTDEDYEDEEKHKEKIQKEKINAILINKLKKLQSEYPNAITDVYMYYDKPAIDVSGKTFVLYIDYNGGISMTSIDKSSGSMKGHKNFNSLSGFISHLEKYTLI